MARPVSPQASPADILDIQRAACRHFGITKSEMTGLSRRRCIARPRQVAMYVAHSLHGKPLTQVGRIFGQRHHTTVLHASRAVRAMIEDGDAAIAYAVAAITAALNAAIVTEGAS